MKRALHICLTGLLVMVSVVACNQVEAPKGAHPKAYLRVLEQGLAEHHESVWFPKGKITILNGASSVIDSGDAKSMRFRHKYLKFLQRAENDGLLTVKAKQQIPLDLGARIFIVTPTEKLRQMADPKASNEKWLRVPIATMKVLKIVSEEPCKLQQASPGDEFLLIVGLISVTPSQEAKTLGPEYATADPHKLKFRAILQVNPFDKSYNLLVADLGKPSETAWTTDSVAQRMKD